MAHLIGVFANETDVIDGKMISSQITLKFKTNLRMIVHVWRDIALGGARRCVPYPFKIFSIVVVSD